VNHQVRRLRVSLAFSPGKSYPDNAAGGECRGISQPCQLATVSCHTLQLRAHPEFASTSNECSCGTRDPLCKSEGGAGGSQLPSDGRSGLWHYLFGPTTATKMAVERLSHQRALISRYGTNYKKGLYEVDWFKAGRPRHWTRRDRWNRSLGVREILYKYLTFARPFT
jgi:hypothetical protein